jgi:glycosidase
MRRNNPALIYGDLQFTLTDDVNNVLAYSRKLAENEIDVVFNRSDSIKVVNLTVLSDGDFEDMLSPGSDVYRSNGRKIEISLGPLSGMVLRRQ